MPPLYIVTGTVTATGTPGFDASGTDFELFNHTQDWNATYKQITYGKTDDNAWPPNESCTTASAVEITFGHSWAHTWKSNYNATSIPGTHEPQTYGFSSYAPWGASTSGLGMSGIIYADREGKHVRAWKTTDSAAYNTTNWSVPRSVIVEVGSAEVFTGYDGGVAANQFIRMLLAHIKPGGLPQGVASWLDPLPLWRDDLVL